MNSPQTSIGGAGRADGAGSTPISHDDAVSTRPADPRGPYAVEWLAHNIPDRWHQGGAQATFIRVRNVGSRTWRMTPNSDGDAVDLVVRAGEHIHLMVRVPHEVPPDTEVTFGFTHVVPFVLFWSAVQTSWSFNLVEQNVAWFADHGVEPLEVPVLTLPTESGAAAEALHVGSLTCSAFHLPSGGVSRGRDGRPYPLFARSCAGSRVQDLEGSEWIDYVMGWGAALLGYAHPNITAAVRSALGSGAVTALPTATELEAAQLLCEAIPCAEQALFGKNGSDVCTAAVRLARVVTGRQKILFSGYSGWQEPFASAFETRLREPDRPAVAYRFPTGDLEAVQQLFDEHDGQVAAVILEPGAQVEGVEGPVGDADEQFLRELASLCRSRGTLLIFDEIFTGFRHPHGSVQRATGVYPDLACFGKALSSGLPLSALVGRRDVLSHVREIFYHPTFKGEAYSFAAAAAALRFYVETDVPTVVATFGTKLMQGVDDVSERVGVDGGMVGLPYRMVYRFREPDASRRALMRTLLQQELLKGGVMTFRGFLLPSIAHGDSELGRTLSAYEAALRRVAEACDSAYLEPSLEIPTIV